MKPQAIPEYDGAECTSSCGNDYDCPHEERFDEARGIKRSGLDFDIRHDNTTTHFEVVLIPTV